MGGCARALAAAPELLMLARTGMLNFSVCEMIEKVSSTTPYAEVSAAARANAMHTAGSGGGGRGEVPRWEALSLT